ncbi:hypothetical protein [Pseudoduganella albidiflava]|uniref:Tetratricopeptide repeat protein n=1 Tax=Pseudoduganella albidiflava TaxID=321983 RepID=A0A411WYZ7_9BURK|nr:hypothetical protein [Pseudoduganella albidiflava]QBI01929.1 hypothetical protein EYF70_14495 [Pseudoduganella albidiflava]GGY38508.1 hypothetical protein GCM10007387_20620 [Pseudoduganella albidiflava]
MARRAPAGIAALLLAALAAQCALHAVAPGPARSAPVSVMPPPGPPLPDAALRLASLGDGPTAARLVMLYLHASDAGIPLRELDYGHLAGWLEAALALDPRSRQPLVAAAQVYGVVADPARVRIMLGVVERAFAADPARRWPDMVQAALLARHSLHDMALARRYAQALRLRAPLAPAWARQLELFILQDMNELDSARAVAGALLASGTITDPNDIAFLEGRLRELERAASHGTHGQVR